MRPTIGDLRVEYLTDALHLRPVQMARLLSFTNIKKGDLLPPLYDVRLIAMSPAAFTLGGLERLDGAEYAQTWLVRATSI
jgi:hypothetical protein